MFSIKACIHCVVTICSHIAVGWNRLVLYKNLQICGCIYTLRYYLYNPLKVLKVYQVEAGKEEGRLMDA